VDPLEQAGVAELLQVAADGIRRDREQPAQLGHDDLAVVPEGFDDPLSPLSRQHDAMLRGSAVFCKYSRYSAEIRDTT
jgi:hypothetical protein